MKKLFTFMSLALVCLTFGQEEELSLMSLVLLMLILEQI